MSAGERVHLVVVSAVREILQLLKKYPVPLAPDQDDLAVLGGAGDGFGPQDLAAGRRPADDGKPGQGVDEVVDVVERGTAGLLLDDDRGEGAVHRGGRGHGLHDRSGALLEPDDVEDVKVGLLVAEKEADRPIRIFVLRGAPGPGKVPVSDGEVDGRG